MLTPSQLHTMAWFATSHTRKNLTPRQHAVWLRSLEELSHGRYWATVKVGKEVCAIISLRLHPLDRDTEVGRHILAACKFVRTRNFNINQL